MKKRQLIVIIILILLTIIAPTRVEAKTKNAHQESEVVYNILHLNQEKNVKIKNLTLIADQKKDKTDGWLDDYNQNQSCTGKNAILGSYDDPDSVAWLLQKIFNYIKILGPLIVIVMSGIDFSKVIVMGDDEGLKKAQTKLAIRLILAAALFVLPDLVSSLLKIFNITSSGICGLQ